jgi:hypothetical protein
VKTGATVPGYSGGFAAAWLFRVWIFCSRGSLTLVTAPNFSPNDLLADPLMRAHGVCPPIVLGSLPVLSQWRVSNMNKLQFYDNYGCNV